MTSVQVATTSLLRQFATEIAAGELAVTSKLGSSTVSRVKFKRLEFPAGHEEQLGFLKGLIELQHPTAPEILRTAYSACLSDQVKAVNSLLAQ